MKKFNLSELLHQNKEIKNTNYRMWKSGKKWIYASSILTMIVGGIAGKGLSLSADENDAVVVIDAPSEELEETAERPSLLVEPTIAVKETLRVSGMLDDEREDFENVVLGNDNTPIQSATSLYVPLPYSVRDVYNGTAATMIKMMPDIAIAGISDSAVIQGAYVSVSNMADFKLAYEHKYIRYIDIAADFSYADAVGGIANATSNSLAEHTESLIINGNGHTVDFGRMIFRLGNPSDNTPFTVTGLNVIGRTDDDLALFNAAKARAKWDLNIDNVSYTGNVNRLFRLLGNASDNKVTLSGNVYSSCTQELGLANQVDFANGANVVHERSAEGKAKPMIEASSYPSTFNVGDGVTIVGDATQQTIASSGELFHDLNTMTVGDNVTWYQASFPTLFGASTNRNYTFGKNFNMTAVELTSADSWTVSANSNFTFGTGAVLNIEQWHGDNVIEIANGGTVRFASPKALRINQMVDSGSPLINGAGQFMIDNSSIVNQGDSLKFATMTISGGTAKIDRVAGDTTTPTSLPVTDFHELQVNDVANGTIKINYIDQAATSTTDTAHIVKTIDFDVNAKDAYGNKQYYIGQELLGEVSTLVHDNMPENYKWALGNQVNPIAATDQQAKGDPTTTSDNGNAKGQLERMIVPMEGVEYVYNVYVHANDDADVQYQYVNSLTGEILDVSGVKLSELEAVRGLATASVGSIIDWSNPYYAFTTIPDGYKLDDTKPLPKNLTVAADNNPISQFSVVPTRQRVELTIKAVNSEKTQTITVWGVTGQTMTYAELVAQYNDDNLLPYFEGYRLSDEDEAQTFTFDNSDTLVRTGDKAGDVWIETVDEAQKLELTLAEDIQTGSVTYLDGTTGKTLEVKPISGIAGTAISNSSDCAAQIAAYVADGYVLKTSTLPMDATFDHDRDVSQDYLVTLVHNTHVVEDIYTVNYDVYHVYDTNATKNFITSQTVEVKKTYYYDESDKIEYTKDTDETLYALNGVYGNGYPEAAKYEIVDSASHPNVTVDENGLVKMVTVFANDEVGWLEGPDVNVEVNLNGIPTTGTDRGQDGTATVNGSGTINYERDVDSLEHSDNVSDSDEDSDSEEDSDSDEDSDSEQDSESESNYKVTHYSEALSDSLADSESTEDSDSLADSDSEQDSDSTADSDSSYHVAHHSEALSDSLADSESTEDSDSLADSDSEQDSDSIADSDSSYHVAHYSDELSDSLADSESTEDSDSLADSDSEQDSESIVTSDSSYQVAQYSDDLSDSLEDSESTEDSDSLEDSDSIVTSDSSYQVAQYSDDLSDSLEDSESTEDSDSLEDSDSIVTSDSSYQAAQYSDDLSDSLEDSESTEDSDSLADSDSEQDSDSIVTSDSSYQAAQYSDELSDSLEDSESTEESDSLADSDSEQDSDSIVTSDSSYQVAQYSDELSDSLEDSESTEESDSLADSDSEQDSDSIVTSDSSYQVAQYSDELSDSLEDSESMEESDSLADSDSEQDSDSIVTSDSSYQVAQYSDDLSDSLEDSESMEESDSLADSDSEQDSDSIVTSDSSYQVAQYSDELSDSLEDSESMEDSDSLADSDSEQDSDSIVTSDSAYRVIQYSEDLSDSLEDSDSALDSDSVADSESEEFSDSVFDSDSLYDLEHAWDDIPDNTWYEGNRDNEIAKLGDVDGDGVPNSLDDDIDGDGVPNDLDDDRDGDGISNDRDQTPNGAADPVDNGHHDGDLTKPIVTPADVDGDGLSNLQDPDIDGDGVPNVIDPDIDGDGIFNAYDPTPNGDQSGQLIPDNKYGNGDKTHPITAPGDVDNDGVPNSKDEDIDGDGIPNAIDPDIDGDGIPNEVDRTPFGAPDPFVIPNTAPTPIAAPIPLTATPVTPATPIPSKILPNTAAADITDDSQLVSMIGLGGLVASAAYLGGRKPEVSFVTLTTDNYIKRTDDDIPAEKVKFVKAQNTTFFAEKASLSDAILLFTNLGRMIYSPVQDLAQVNFDSDAKGQAISELANDIETFEKVVFAKVVSSFASDELLTVVTKKGFVKQIALSDLTPNDNYKETSVVYDVLSEDDVVFFVNGTSESSTLFTTENHNAVMIDISEIPVLGLSEIGTRLQALAANDSLSRCFC
ncbi:hypothetical protein Hs30E_11380 [Lactococcus hodotermopsidis]|uniref:Mucin binding domain-containing protein n=1 Tax=Pseudolactococcus hodotermopsidis TaxID=2709157 RepID=A0A6A0BFH9_9LACT|nr:pectate lyase-like adhesive domain-containing protein [Lactococcus hodotermopsidis]GFH42587.1 hypothetical protein Hs30E_11380 [Lactococcus hodotermopsidis]